ncbi:RNA polymerase sigma factor [Roseiconus lacunae]|uniref:Sigma-70 family RNA polymerase sigma factor n=1 Tax=Roseiconus lacunae TaxID=2605694 RepID=A0ABT7PIB7_9BACT|nr:sigma-70 family RNA polymerase sigma factor [Roseiconus lacunae]MDM4016239.1 sigma-70 family RNA polymerase sigma factor [Roseiconus lacunae]WRQ52158.1 sigma-70 family RNA polymerase sigma factor [Stieleria sp. HD01]
MDDPSNLSTATLAEQVINDDATAFAVLMKRYHTFVYGICFAILKHRQDAEDATQETFSRVLRYLHRWDPRRPFEPWLATVAGNRSRTHLARRRSHSPLSDSIEPQSTAMTEALAASAIAEEIRLALRALPTRQRTAFELFHDCELSYDEIARQMDCPVGTAKTLVHRARKQMVSALRDRDVLQSSQRRAS